MEEKYIKFENRSKINIIKSTENKRGRSSQKIYYSDAFKKYNTLKGQIELVENQAGKLNWHQKLRLIFWIKYDDIVNYFTDPYRVLNRYVNKK